MYMPPAPWFPLLFVIFTLIISITCDNSKANPPWLWEDSFSVISQFWILVSLENWILIPDIPVLAVFFENIES